MTMQQLQKLGDLNSRVSHIETYRVQRTHIHIDNGLSLLSFLTKKRKEIEEKRRGEVKTIKEGKLRYLLVPG